MGTVDDSCDVCGSPFSGGANGAIGTFAQHILDRNDPHGTLRLVPSVEVGHGPPASAQGYRFRDMYVDVSGQRLYVAVEVDGNTEWMPASASAGVTGGQLSSVLAGYVTNESLLAKLDGYVTASSMRAYARTSDLSAYASVQQVTNLLSGYVRSDSVSGYGFVTSSSLAETLGLYMTRRDISALLTTTYLSRADAASTYVAKDDLSRYLSVDDVPGALAGRVFRNPTSPGTYPELDLDIILGGFLTTADAAATYVTPGWLATHGYVDTDSLNEAVSGLVTRSGLDDALASCLTSTDADRLYLRKDDYVSPESVLSRFAGCVVRSPTSPGVYPEMNLDVVLQAYLSKADANNLYVTRTLLEGMGYVSRSDVSAMLSGYVSSESLSRTLSPYLTKADAAMTYVTPGYLASNGYLRNVDKNSFVYRQGDGAELDLDKVLNSWPAQEITPSEGKPPTAAAVYSGFSRIDRAVADLRRDMGGVVVTGGAANVLNVIEEPESLSDSFMLIPAMDRACNVVVVSGDWPVRASNTFAIAVPNTSQDGMVARDFIVVLDFPAGSGTDQVPIRFLGFRTRSGDRAQVFSYTASGLFSMDGVAYGMKVVFACTDVGSGVLAVTRKNLYEV